MFISKQREAPASRHSRANRRARIMCNDTRSWRFALRPIMKAIWNNTVIAESNDTVVVENNHYFPADSIKKEFFEDSIAQTSCPWKGRASYYSLKVNGEQNKDAAWYYPEPKDAAKEIKGHVAFWKGVKVEK